MLGVKIPVAGSRMNAAGGAPESRPADERRIERVPRLWDVFTDVMEHVALSWDARTDVHEHAPWIGAGTFLVGAYVQSLHHTGGR